MQKLSIQRPPEQLLTTASGRPALMHHVNIIAISIVTVHIASNVIVPIMHYVPQIPSPKDDSSMGGFSRDKAPSLRDTDLQPPSPRGC